MSEVAFPKLFGWCESVFAMMGIGMGNNGVSTTPKHTHITHMNECDCVSGVYLGMVLKLLKGKQWKSSCNGVVISTVKTH